MTRFILKIFIVFFVVEVLIMAGFLIAPPIKNTIVLVAIDAALLVLISSPVIYFWAIRSYITAFKLLEQERNKARNQLANAIDSLTEGFAYFDADDRLVLCNKKYRDYYEESADLIVPGAKFEDIIRGGAERGQYPDAVGRVEEWVSERMEQHLTGGHTIVQKLANNRWMQISEQIMDDGGRVGNRIDITEIKQAGEELRKLSSAVEYSSSGVIIADLNGVIEYVNPKICGITGYSQEELIGQRLSILQSGTTPVAVYQDLWKTISTGKEWTGVLCNRKKNSELYWGRNSISSIKDTLGAITHYISSHDDDTQDVALKEQLTFQASHDSLTGLINRSEFERRVERLLSTVMQGKIEHVLCFMDLDQFKVINDTCGHAAGDDLLRQLGQVLKDTVRHRDTLARLGGDEFGILMEHCSLEQSQRVANTLQKAIENFQFSWEGQSFRVGVSIGLAAINETTPDLTELLKQADSACYMAKELGRNRIHIYYPENVEMARRLGQMQWVAGINQALEEDRFCLYAQAIVPLTNGAAGQHYELLLRMLNEQGEIILPDNFLPAAERYGLIGQLDAWVINNAFTLLAEHPDFVDQIHLISINLSGPSLTNGEFLDSIISQLKDSAIDPGKICFEVTETVAISNLSAAISFIETLKTAGCHFSLDDFGSGLSSFGYLKKLPVDYLKIDGMFVRDIADDRIDYAMVKSINEIGHVMGMQTIAEFVENDEIKGMLKEIGVDYAQGYGIERPRPLAELLSRSKNDTD